MWKVGELASRTGLTVRTLHHYDELGLLAPARRTTAGHRLYGEEQVMRLQQIVALRGLGFSLEEVSVEEILATIEAMTMFDKYFTPEQMEQLDERRKVVTEERIREVEAEWPKLIAEVRADMEKGTDPSSERVQELARRWKGLVEEFTGGDIQIAASGGRMYQQEESARQRTGLDAEIMEYIGRASAAAG